MITQFKNSFLLIGRLAICLTAVGLSVTADAQVDGRKIYLQQCASCHGKDGTGVAGRFDDPLIGDLSLDELTRYVSESMPEEEPESCVADDAEAVAKFVFETFYSSAAQARNNQARVQLSRLTVRQYRETIADIVAALSGDDMWIPSERGIKADYFAARNWTEKLRISSQVDQGIDFANGVPHFRVDGRYEILAKHKKPKGANNMNDGFSAYWIGSVIPPETGEYELIVESKNGFQLYVNDPKNPLIDRKVRSDDTVEHKERIYLLGGRPHGFKLELFSYPDPPAKVRVLWKPPNQPVAVIPGRKFIPNFVAEVGVVSTSFPPDDASFGFERGTDVSAEWDAATTSAAIETANFISQRIWRFAKTKPTDPKSIPKIKEFCKRFVSLAFVTKLTEAEEVRFIDQHFEQAISVEDQVKRVVIMTLKSPRFLFPAFQPRDLKYERLRRLTLALWDSVPERQLAMKANKGRLDRVEQLANEMHWMVDHPRSREKLQSFFEYWLKMDHVAHASKDMELFPGFDDEMVVDLKESLLLYLDDVVWSETSDFRQLFLADHLFVNDRLADFYQLEHDSKTQFSKVKVDENQRAGILTHPFLMTGFAYHKDSSPIHRGVFIAKSLLGRRLRQPPDNVEPLTEEFDPSMTTRERVEHQTKETTCMNCHSVINPLGFSLENFDAVGRFRTQEKEKPIDVTSVYRTPDGNQVELNGPRDLANFLVANEAAQRSFVRQLFNHYAKQPIEAYGEGTLDRLHQSFQSNDFNIRQLLMDIAMRITLEGLE